MIGYYFFKSSESDVFGFVKFNSLYHFITMCVLVIM